ncbi:hypothetical protein K470DRAFT_272981 [Piedraia hortae CBS 480.64]|uniref:Uncharacterized protein n=1 Tax=Piedraia hortae CBS 480.64 TaxID=1314780 RepID=A0A6A7BS95_9PEZI|nr:hypothetical protein K470DRAFT_272981 [Piedraia hortae CBS 480.64]
MSRKHIVSSYYKILERWPEDPLRPKQRHFQRLLRARIKAPPTPFRDERKEVNAAFNLLNNAFAKRWKLGEMMMKPASAPTHYSDLRQELEELPHRTWLQHAIKRIKSMVRFQ